MLPASYKTAETIYAAMLAAEPEATAERRAELLIEAKAQVRTPDLYWDATFSVSKSISLFHASALANAAAAAQRGDLESVQAWEEVADGIWDAIMEGNAAALDYLQREAGQTRAGYHPGGRWEDAREWVIASFRQHTSRDGDPQLHVHNLILHKVRRESDGEWRALDSMSLYRHRPAASAIAALAAENALTRRIRRPLGAARRRPRPGDRRRGPGADGHVLLAAAEHRPAHRAPGAGVRGAVRARAGRTRAGEPAPVGQPRHPARQGRRPARPGGAGAPVVGAGPRQRGRRARTPRARRHGHQRHGPARDARATKTSRRKPHVAPLTEPQAQRLIQEAVAAVQTAQPTWTEADLIRHLGERLPAHVGAMSAPRRRRAAARPGPPGPGHRGGRAVRAGMAARARLPAPRLRREPVHPARRDPLRHQRAAHPGRPPARPGATRPAPRAWSPRPRRACSARIRRTSRRNSRRKRPLKTYALNGSRPGCASIRPPPPSRCLPPAAAPR